MNIKDFESNFGKQEYFEYSDYWIVYFLVDLSGEIVYVGKTSSTKLGNRLRSHAKTKVFKSYFVNSGPKTEEEAYKLEGAFISMLRPKYNQKNVSFCAKEIQYFYEWMGSSKESGCVSYPTPWWVKVMFYGFLLLITVTMCVIFGFIGYTAYLAQYYILTTLSFGVLIWMILKLGKALFFAKKREEVASD